MLLDKATFEQKVKGFAPRRSQSYISSPAASRAYEKPARDTVSDSAVSTSGKSSRDLKIERLKQAEIAHLQLKREKQVVDHKKRDRETQRYIRDEERQIRLDRQDPALPLPPPIADGSSEISIVTTNSSAFHKLGVAAAVAYAVTKWRQRNRIVRSLSAPLLAHSTQSSPTPGTGGFLMPPLSPNRPRSSSGGSRSSRSSSLMSASSMVAPVS